MGNVGVGAGSDGGVVTVGAGAGTVGAGSVGAGSDGAGSGGGSTVGAVTVGRVGTSRAAGAVSQPGLPGPQSPRVRQAAVSSLPLTHEWRAKFRIKSSPAGKIPGDGGGAGGGIQGPVRDPGRAEGRRRGDAAQRLQDRARALHPDVSKDPDAEERFRELSHAYDVLSKPRSRLLDRLAYRGPGGGGFGPAHEGVGRPTKDSAHLSEEELIGWIFTEDTPDPGAPVPREDRLLRVMAAIALAIAIVLIVIVLFR